MGVKTPMIQLTKRAADIGIVVADLDAQRRFYGEVLGLPYAGRLPVGPGEVHIYLLGDSLLKLYRYPSGSIKPRQMTLADFGTHGGLAYITLTVRDLASTFSALEGRGAAVLARPNVFLAESDLGPPVGRIHARFALVADGDGNMIELFEYLNADGTAIAPS
jgi:catechol 2,3-dioxygenase-like lactoylglutathione lyase family enzyme